MDNYLKSNFIIEEKVKLKEIPAIIFRPKEVIRPISTVIFYHGWGSSKESQRMRGLILSCMGYQVVIPDAIYHGERSPLNNYSMNEAKEYFWDVIFKNLEEFDIIVSELTSKYNANPEKIAVMGNSMGGFTAGGVFSHNKFVKTLIVFNGSCSWENFNNGAEESINNVKSEKFKIIENKVKNLDPMNFLNLLKNRPILLLHGDCDTTVPVDGQRSFYNKLSPLYEDNEKIKLVEYPKLNHFVTTNMMEESINWLGKYL